MKILTSKIFWGVVLILGGVLFLLQNLGIFQGGTLFWGVSILIAGLLFLGVFLGDRQQWWALIPGMILLAIGVMILLAEFVPEFNEALGGLVILGGIGLSFFFVYLANKANWWAIIPGGALITLAVVACLDQAISDVANGGIFFFGLGLTFALVALAPNPSGKMKWAWIPAIILVLIGLIVYFAAEDLLVYLLPAVLLIAGGFLIWRAIRSH
jgi:hypothetical protein